MNRSRATILVLLALTMSLLPTAGVAQDGSQESASGAAGEACDPGDAACFDEIVAEAIGVAERLPSDIRVQPPDPFQGGQRTDSMVNYLVDTIFLVDGYWSTAFDRAGLPYGHVNYVVLDVGTDDQESNCRNQQTGAADMASAGSGPFYCRAGGQALDRRFDSSVVYIGAPWLADEAMQVDPENHDFAVVAIVAHEVAHHVEWELLKGQWTAENAVWLELTADCLTGVFSNAAYYGQAGQLTDTDVDEAISILWDFGSDLPYDLGGDPHGTREQRTAAFRLGYDTGRVADCLAQDWPTS